MIIGLTGGIGSGKSTVAKFFRDLGVKIIDADQITRELVLEGKPALEKIVEHFGSQIVQKENNNGDKNILNRKKLREIIFKNSDERLWLEKLLHPLVKQEILEKKIPSYSKEKAYIGYIIVEIPLLIEAHFHDVVDRILVVDSPESSQIKRIVERDQVNTSDVETIVKTQIERSARLAEADDILVNDGTVLELKNKVNNLHKKYIELTT